MAELRIRNGWIDRLCGAPSVEFVFTGAEEIKEAQEAMEEIRDSVRNQEIKSLRDYVASLSRPPWR